MRHPRRWWPCRQYPSSSTRSQWGPMRGHPRGPSPLTAARISPRSPLHTPALLGSRPQQNRAMISGASVVWACGLSVAELGGASVGESRVRSGRGTKRRTVPQYPEEELNFAFNLSSSDIMDDKCDHPAELLGTVDAESSLVAQSENAVSEALGTADVNGGTAHDGSSLTGHAEQTDDEPATNEASHVNAEKGGVAQHGVDSSADEQENQETFPVTGTDASDSTSVTSMEDGLEPKKGAQSEPGDVSRYPPDLCNDKSSNGNGSVYQNAKCVLTSSTKTMKRSKSATTTKPLQATNKNSPDDWNASALTNSKLVNGKTTTVPSGPVFRCTERAEKRREYYSKLEEKHQAMEEQKIQLEARLKREQEDVLRLLRKSLTFKATPMPSFYHEAPSPKAEYKKLPTTRPKSPKLGRKKASMDTSNSSSESESTRPCCRASRNSLDHCKCHNSSKPRQQHPAANARHATAASKKRTKNHAHKVSVLNIAVC